MTMWLSLSQYSNRELLHLVREIEKDAELQNEVLFVHLAFSYKSSPNQKLQSGVRIKLQHSVCWLSLFLVLFSQHLPFVFLSLMFVFT